MRSLEFFDQRLRFARFASEDIADNVHRSFSCFAAIVAQLFLRAFAGEWCENRGASMKWFHLIFGILLFFVFTQTGTLMRSDFPDKDAIPQDFRLLMRSRHIYILFAALINVVLGLYLQLRAETVLKILQIAGSSILAVGSVVLVYAWYVETYGLQHFSDASRWGIYICATGVGLHLFGVVLPDRLRRR
jgi:hypothetical protein